jgi:hypothetical protein
MNHLGTVGRTTLGHTFKLLAQPAFLDLALLLILGVFKVTSVTEFHQVTRLVDLALESTKGGFNWFAITDQNLDLDGKFSVGDWWIVWGRRVMDELEIDTRFLSKAYFSLGCSNASFVQTMASRSVFLLARIHPLHFIQTSCSVKRAHDRLTHHHRTNRSAYYCCPR